MGTVQSTPHKGDKETEKARKRRKISVFIIVWDEYGHILAGVDINTQSTKTFGRFKLPGGGRKGKENLLAVILRECEEETGIFGLQIQHDFIFVGKMLTQALGAQSPVEEYKIVLSALYVGEEPVREYDPHFKAVDFYSPAMLLHEDNASLNLWHRDAVLASYDAHQQKEGDASDIPGLEELLHNQFGFRQFREWMDANNISPRTYDANEIANGS